MQEKTDVYRRSKTLRCQFFGATVNGSTLWRHLDRPGAEGARYTHLRIGISQATGQRRYNNVSVSSYPIDCGLWDIFLLISGLLEEMRRIVYENNQRPIGDN